MSKDKRLMDKENVEKKVLNRKICFECAINKVSGKITEKDFGQTVGFCEYCKNQKNIITIEELCSISMQYNVIY